jgi:dipeptide/tripeptide permease
LYDQHSSRWVEQATQMSGCIGNWEIQPDQMPTLNALFVVLLIPVFDRFLYPLLRRLQVVFVALLAYTQFSCSTLWRIKVGMFITAISFVIAGM